MALPIPDLDNRSFTDLVEEARKLIPVFAPLWTDYNLHDPGITTIDLLAWLTETALYRLNQVPVHRQQKYLKLLGFSPRPPQRARVDLTFETTRTYLLNKGFPVYTQVYGHSFTFELARDIVITPVTLQRLLADKLTVVGFDRSMRNEFADSFYHPFGREIKPGSAFYLGFHSIEPVESVSFTCYFYEKDLIATGFCEEGSNYEYKNACLRWEYSVGTGSGWQEVVPVLDETAGFKRSGTIGFTFSKKCPWLASRILLCRERELRWLRCVVEESRFEYPPRLESIRVNTVPALHGETVYKQEREHRGTGLPGQVIELENSPVGGYPRVCIDKKEWSMVDDFDGSGPGDSHYILDWEKGLVKFGDGYRGRVVPADVPIEVTPYVHGGGREGNINAGCEWRVDGLPGALVKNYRPGFGGVEAETLTEVLARCRQDLKRPCTAVTYEDIERVARLTPGLRIAKAKALVNDVSPVRTAADDVLVVVIPFTPEEYFIHPPVPSPGFLGAVRCHLERHRLVNHRIQVIAPIYVRVDISLDVLLVPGAWRERVQQTIIEYLNRFLHPVNGWLDGNGWPIGRHVFSSEVSEWLKVVPGIERVFIRSLRGDNGAELDKFGNLLLPGAIATVYAGNHRVDFLEESQVCELKKRV